MTQRLKALISLASMLSLGGCSNNLAVPHLRQETLLCVPTSAAMILAYYRDPQPPRRLKALASGIRYDPAASFSNFSITRYSDMVEGVKKLGYHWTEMDLADDDDGFSSGIATIRSEISAGHPVMVDMTLPYGHTVVVNGINMLTKTINVVDPDRPDPGEWSLTFDQLQGAWNEHAYGNNIRSLIVTQPKDMALAA